MGDRNPRLNAIADRLQNVSQSQKIATGMTGLMLVVTCIVLGVTLARHKMASGVTAMTVLTSLVLLVPYYRLATYELATTKTTKLFYMASLAFVAWLIIFAIVAGKATPISESFENVPMMPHHHHHIPPAPVEMQSAGAPLQIPMARSLEAFDEDE